MFRVRGRGGVRVRARDAPAARRAGGDRGSDRSDGKKNRIASNIIQRSLALVIPPSHRAFSLFPRTCACAANVSANPTNAHAANGVPRPFATSALFITIGPT